MCPAKKTQALILRQSPATRKPVFHDVVVEDVPIPELKPNGLLVKVHAVSLNHRDLWIRKGMYPAIAFDSTLGSDAAGTVVAAANSGDELLNQRVFLVPMRGWETDLLAPETSLKYWAEYDIRALVHFPNTW